MPPNRPQGIQQAGVTVLELLVVVTILGLVTGIAIGKMAAVSGGLKAGTDELVTITKSARTLAMSTTTPHRMVPTSDTSISIEYGGPAATPEPRGPRWPTSSTTCRPGPGCPARAGTSASPPVAGRPTCMTSG